MKFRKKPIEIDAEQFFPDKFPWPESVEKSDLHDIEGNSIYTIKTLEGDMIIDTGDWIITGIKGEKYLCKPDIFEATYEKVEEDEDNKYDYIPAPECTTGDGQHAMKSAEFPFSEQCEKCGELFVSIAKSSLDQAGIYIIPKKPMAIQ